MAAPDPAASVEPGDSLRQLGATLVRVYFFWSQVEPEPGRFGFDAVDAFLEQLDGSRRSG